MLTCGGGLTPRCEVRVPFSEKSCAASCLTSSDATWLLTSNA